MSEAFNEYLELQEATRLRLSKTTVRALRDLAECYGAVGDDKDRIMATGLGLLLDMHDRLEAIRHGQT